MDDIRGNTEVEHTGPLAGEQAGSSGATEHTEVQAAALGATTSTILPIVNTLPDDVHVGDLDGSIAVSVGNRGSRKRAAKGSKRNLAKKKR
jgi:hypothetical protein